jgi:hypothetical protein
MPPEIILKSFSEIEYFDPSLLLRFDRGRIPNPFRALWRGLRFLLAEVGRDGGRRSLAERKRSYESYLRAVDSVIDLVPKGWFALDGLAGVLRPYLSSQRGRLLTFDHLRTDLFICATDLTRGRAVLFGKAKFAERVAHTPFFSKHQYISGQSLLQAILCSSAIPFLFVPHAVHQEMLADGDVKNAAAVGVAKSLVGARFMVTINPLVPLPHVDPYGSTSRLSLQTILSALEGNVVATLKLEFEEKYLREELGEKSFDIVYFRPSPEDMQAMTEGSIVNLFRYQARNVFCGYHAVFQTMREHPAEASAILDRYGYSFDLSVAERRHALLESRLDTPAALEDALLVPKDELSLR